MASILHLSELRAKDGTTAFTIADSTGIVDFNDQILKKCQLQDYSENVFIEAGSKFAAFDIDHENGNVQGFTIGTGTFSVGIVNALSTKSSRITLFLTNFGAGTVTLKAGTHSGSGNAVKWSGGSAPSWTSSGVDVVTLVTSDGGTNYYGFVEGLNFS